MTAPAAPARDRMTTVTMVALLVLAVGLQATRDTLAPPRAPSAPTLWLQSPEATRRIMLSFTDLAADVYWTRAVVHYGGERRSPAAAGRYSLLYPLLDMATTLDPHFDVAARMGAIFLSEGYPGGPGRPDQALLLLQKGLRHDPDRWQYRHDIAFVHYWWLKDYVAAAREFEEASRLPGAPPWLRTMAAVTLTKGGDRESARKMWSELLATADLDWLRDAALFRLRQLAALDDIDALTVQLARLNGHVDRSWQTLIRAGALAGVPVDPTGVPYEITPAGVVVLGAESSLSPLPEIDTKP
ncbi:MAG TPA: tetratricopeptide repeat protein [Vicinamibacterales bacterium]|nr:tetratricopeptide repeat protein [Vicinamibacterales bacterium]